MSNDSLGDRIKRYEAVYQHHLTPRSYLVVRVDGRAFHTFTRGCERPFDPNIINAMIAATKATAADMHGFKLAYTQSDEASFLLSDFDTLTSQGWFDYALSKIISISASLFTAHFNDSYPEPRSAVFDSRAFTVPTEDAPNVFLWRQRDWERNSLQMLARSLYSHEELQNRSHADIHEMLHAKGQNWANLPGHLKNGTFVLPGGQEITKKLDFAGIAEMIRPVET